MEWACGGLYRGNEWGYGRRVWRWSKVGFCGGCVGGVTCIKYHLYLFRRVQITNSITLMFIFINYFLSASYSIYSIYI